MILIFALGAVSCNKHLPELQQCGCELDAQGNVKGGAKMTKELAICGVFDFAIGSNVTPATTIEASLGYVPYGTYVYAEILANPRQLFFSSPVLASYTADFKYFISASIKDLKGNPLVEIKDNKWFVYVRNVGKYNYDANGFEVFDKAGHISLSIDFRHPDAGFVNLEVQGVIPTTSSTLKFYDYNLFAVNLIDFQYGTPALNQAFEDIYNGVPIKPMFRYEGSGWQHARLP